MLYKSARSRAMRRPMSQLIRNLFSAREEERLLKGALGCAIPEFIARFGAADAVKRVELELRRARRARSRRLYAFWSAVLAQIATPTKESSIRKRVRRARTVRPRGAASVLRRLSIARASVFVSTVTRDGAGFQPSPARSSQASAPPARHSAASRPKTCATPLRRQRNHECAAPPTGCGIHSRHHRTFRRGG